MSKFSKGNACASISTTPKMLVTSGMRIASPCSRSIKHSSAQEAVLATVTRPSDKEKNHPTTIYSSSYNTSFCGSTLSVRINIMDIDLPFPVPHAGDKILWHVSFISQASPGPGFNDDRFSGKEDSHGIKQIFSIKRTTICVIADACIRASRLHDLSHALWSHQHPIEIARVLQHRYVDIITSTPPLHMQASRPWVRIN